jgi:hypothetical protein
VGKTSASGSTAGAEFRADGRAIVVVDDNYAGFFARQSTDGEIVRFLKDTTTVGSIGAFNDDLNIYSTTSGHRGLRFRYQAIVPVDESGTENDNGTDLGASNVRFDDVFATNGTIQTSDENEKQDIAPMTTAELAVGKRLSTLFKTFRWKSKVTKKADKARTHSGIVAQEVKAAFEAEGLDATKYALFCSDTWTNDDGKEQTRMGVRYPELLSFIASYNESRFTAIEERLTALEGG